MAVTGMDHVAIPAGDPEALMTFYRALGFTILHEAEWRAGDFPAFAIACGDRRAGLRRFLLRLGWHPGVRLGRHRGGRLRSH